MHVDLITSAILWPITAGEDRSPISMNDVIDVVANASFVSVIYESISIAKKLLTEARTSPYNENPMYT